jgi:hypothetical protein
VAQAETPKEWDKEPVDLELEELARGIDLQFEDPAAHREEKPDVELRKADDEKD